jgi:hypothetical protein
MLPIPIIKRKIPLGYIAFMIYKCFKVINKNYNVYKLLVKKHKFIYKSIFDDSDKNSWQDFKI